MGGSEGPKKRSELTNGMIWWLMVAYQIGVLIVDCILLWCKAILFTMLSMYRLLFPAERKSVVGEIVLVTGAGHGIGREMALQFARLGAKVICLDLNEEWNTQTVALIKKEGGLGWGYRCDVSNRKDVKDVTEKIRRLIGDVTILVNNVGIMPCKPFLRHTEEEIQKLFQINVLSQFWMIREWLPTFKANGGGHIVGMSSLCGIMGTPNLVPYCSSKFAITGLLEGLTEELRYGNQNPNIKITRIHPYTVDTGLAKKPRIKFPSINPIVTPEECASAAINGVLREEEVVFVPNHYYYTYKILAAIPRKLEQAILDFLDTGVDSHED